MKSSLLALTTLASAAFAADGNRLAYLDSDDPFYPHRGLARLTTPQWIGEEGVEAVVILSIDDLRETQKYEDYLRPVLERLKQIDGRAPFSIFCNTFDPDAPQFQTWLAEGVSLEVHTLAHPCPLLGKMRFSEAWHTVHGGLDLLAKIPGNTPVAFRMPCCDSMNSASPRFLAEILPDESNEGRFFAMDSSVGCLLTEGEDAERFRKYHPTELKPPMKLTFERFGAFIEDYPYPYVVSQFVWELPFVVPSDWAAFNLHGPKNPRTLEDWKAALDTIVRKQGVMTLVLHPHGWSDPQQLVALIDYAEEKHGRRVKFLNFPEALARLERQVLGGRRLFDGARVLDLDGDGFMDAVAGEKTRVWQPRTRSWSESALPIPLTSHERFGLVRGDGAASMISTGVQSGAWHFTGGQWVAAPLLRGIDRPLGPGARLRDCDDDGRCELLVSDASGTTIHRWSDEKSQWEKVEWAWPEGVSLVNARGEDNGLRFVDLNGDGCDDLVFSNDGASGIWLWAKNVNPGLGWKAGWSIVARTFSPRSLERQSASLPHFVRTGRNNGAWFKDGRMFLQNEDTAKLGNVVEMRTYQELIAFDTPPPKSPEESLAAIKVRDGFTVELVAAEPLVVDPIAFEWDARGRLWVVEMRDYPLGMDGKGKPGGVVKVLEDTDGDGRYDQATPFLEDLPFPTGVQPWRDGVLVSAAPDLLYAEDTDGDGRADVRRVLFTGFAPGNQQHRFNGFEIGLDGWIYCANGDSGGEVKSLATGRSVNIHGRDIRLRPDTGEIEAIEGQTQYGRRCDDFGNWFGNNNPTWLWHYPIPENAIARNPQLAVKTLKQVLANYPDSTRVFPISTPPIRFNQPQSLNHVTSAYSPTPYRDELFGPDFARGVFISEPVHNVVHREVLVPDGVTFTSRRADDEQDSEFLASTDNWFRPTMLKTGPDGALYIADMYRFVLEHPQWIAPETQARLDLRAGEDTGRIYRVFPEKNPPRAIPDLTKLDAAGLVAALDSPSGWQRTTVQRLLVAQADWTPVPALEKLARESSSPKTRIHALCTIDGLCRPTLSTLAHALADKHPAVRETAVRLYAPEIDVEAPVLLSAFGPLVNDPAIRVRFRAALELGRTRQPGAGAILSWIAEHDGGNSFQRTAIMSSAMPHFRIMLKLLLDTRTPPDPALLVGLIGIAAAEKDRGTLETAWQKVWYRGARPEVWRFEAAAAILAALKKEPLSGSELVSSAARTLLDSENANRDPRLVIAALKFYSQAVDEAAAEIVQLPAPQVPQEVQMEAAATLARKPGGEGERVLLAGWASYAPGLRAEVLRLILARTAAVQELLVTVESERIAPGEIDAATRALLLQHKTEAIRTRAAKLFDPARSDRQKLVSEYLAAMPAVGDRERGGVVFRAQCALCHRLRGEGVEVGPDLAMVAGKPVEELLAAILDPNRSIEARYLAYAATAKDGRALAGILASESANAIVLRAPGGAEQTVLRAELQELTSTGRSLMPEGREQAIGKEPMADLLRYLRGP